MIFSVGAVMVLDEKGIDFMVVTTKLLICGHTRGCREEQMITPMEGDFVVALVVDMIL